MIPLPQSAILERLLRWHWDATDRLAADELIGGLPWLSEFPKSMDAAEQMVQRMRRLLDMVTGAEGADARGLVGFVQAPESAGGQLANKKLVLPVTMRITVAESRVHNSGVGSFAADGWHAHNAIVRAAQSMQNFRAYGVLDVARPQQLGSDHAGWLPPEFRDANDTLDLISWGFEVTSNIDVGVPDKLKPPEIVIADEQITITAPEAGTTIRYSLDGQYPSEKNNSPVYDAPVALTRPVTIRAVATKSGFIDSDVAQWIVTS